MKRLLLAIGLLTSAAPASGVDYVDGYQRHGGPIAPPVFCKPSDGYWYNKWETYPRLNKYTGDVTTHYRSRSTFYRTTPTSPPTIRFEAGGDTIELQPSNKSLILR